MAKRWVILNKSEPRPTFGEVTRIEIRPKAPVEKREQRQSQLRGDLELQVIAKRREQLSTVGERLGHLTARGASEGGSVRQWTPEELQKSASADGGLSVFWRERPAGSHDASRGGIGRITPKRHARGRSTGR